MKMAQIEILLGSTFLVKWKVESLFRALHHLGAVKENSAFANRCLGKFLLRSVVFNSFQPVILVLETLI